MYYEVINTKTPQDIMWTVLKANVNFNLKDEVSYLFKMLKYFSQNCFRVASMYLQNNVGKLIIRYMCLQRNCRAYL